MTKLLAVDCVTRANAGRWQNRKTAGGNTGLCHNAAADG